MSTRDHGGSGQMVWLPARDGDGRSCPPPDGLRLTSVERAGQGHWGGSSKNWHQG